MKQNNKINDLEKSDQACQQIHELLDEITEGFGPDGIPGDNVVTRVKNLITHSKDNEQESSDWHADYCDVLEKTFEQSRKAEASLYACHRIMDAIAGHSDWHPDPVCDEESWNPDAHIEVTLTIEDCRAVKKALHIAGILEPFLNKDDE